MTANLAAVLDSRHPEYREGIELALELVGTALNAGRTDPGPYPTDRRRTPVACYEPVLTDLLSGAEISDDVRRRIAAFVFGIGELAHTAASTYDNASATDTASTDLARAIATAFWATYLTDLAATSTPSRDASSQS